MAESNRYQTRQPHCKLIDMFQGVLLSPFCKEILFSPTHVFVETLSIWMASQCCPNLYLSVCISFLSLSSLLFLAAHLSVISLCLTLSDPSICTVLPPVCLANCLTAFGSVCRCGHVLAAVKDTMTFKAAVSKCQLSLLVRDPLLVAPQSSSLFLLCFCCNSPPTTCVSLWPFTPFSKTFSLLYLSKPSTISQEHLLFTRSYLMAVKETYHGHF